jgi:protocatechuate 3,4-dioxygenase beta subunit
VFGRILDPNGRPVPDVQVEIWQCDARGIYHHPGDPRDDADPNFQGFGRMTVGDSGGYRFRTIKPVPYPGRTPHIHFALLGRSLARFTTQMYVAGPPLNEHDFVLNHIADPRDRQLLTVSFDPAPELEEGALKANFDIVLGRALTTG